MLEIGSIVYLKKGTQKVMVVSRGAIFKQNGKEVLYDYSACLYPTGIDPQELYYFNEENIDAILFNGFHDEEEVRFQELYRSWYLDEGQKLGKGLIGSTKKTSNLGFE